MAITPIRKYRSLVVACLIVLLLSISLFTARPVFAAPSPPTGVTAIARDSGVELTWNPVSGATSYSVYRKSQSGGSFARIASGLTTTSYTDVGLLNRLALTYAITATDATGESAYSSSTNATPNVAPYAWDFKRPGQDTEGWDTTNQLSRSVSPDGKLMLTMNGTSPQIYSPDNLNMDASQFTGFQVDMLNGMSSATTVDLAWITTTDQTWNAAKTVSFTVAADGAFDTTTLANLAGTNSQWAGTIKRVRFDPAVPGANGVVSKVDFLHFTSSASPAKPLVGAIRWDDWHPSPYYGSQSYFGDPSVFTDYDSRQPFYGWYDSTSLVANHAAIMDEEIDYAANAGLDYWAFDWFENPIVHDSVSYSAAFHDYLNAPNKNRMKYAFVLQTHWVSAGGATNWEQTIVPSLIAHFKDSQYVKVDGNRPVVFWFLTGNLPNATDMDPTGVEPSFSSGFGSNWRQEIDYFVQQVQKANLGTPYIIDDLHDATAAQMYPWDGISDYANGFGGSGHQSWSTANTTIQNTNNQFTYTSSNTLLQVTPALSAVLDHRPRNTGGTFASGPYGGPADWWYDLPTYRQWEDTVRTTYDGLLQYPGRAANPGLIEIYAWNEIDEGGPGIVPTQQLGTMFLDAIHAVVTGAYPAVYYDTLDNSNLSFNYSSNWTYSGPQWAVASHTSFLNDGDQSWGHYNNDETSSSTAGATASLTYNNATGFRLIGTTGPDRGKVDITITDSGHNTVASQTVDEYSPILLKQQVLYDNASLAQGTYTITLTVRSDRNQLSTGNIVSFDAIRVRVGRLGVPTTSPEPPTRLVAVGNESRVDLSWDAVTGAASYTLYRSTTNDDPNPIQIASGITTTTYSDSGRTDGTIYYYVVKAVDSSNNSSGLSNQASAVPSPDLTRTNATYSASSSCTNPTYCNPAEVPSNAFDGTSGTYWQAQIGSTYSQQWLEVDFADGAPPPTFNRVVIQEYSGVSGNRTSGFRIDYYDVPSSSWKTAYTGTTIGASRTITFPSVTGSKVRLVFTAGVYTPIIDAFEVYGAPAGGIVNDTDPGIHYSGSGGSDWVYSPNRGYGDYNNDEHWTTTNGATITYTFNGPVIGFITEKTPSSGSYTIQIDNGTPVTVSTYNTTRIARQLVFLQTGLTEDQHTIKITANLTSGQYGEIDAFTTYPPVNDTDLTYSGSWTYSPNRGYGDYLNDEHATTTNGDSVSYTFTGTGVVFITELNSGNDTYSIQIDGGTPVSVNTNNATRIAQQLVWQNATPLSAGQHTITITKTGGSYGEIDALAIMP